MPASSSTATPIGLRSGPGQNSTRNTATPNAIGSEKISARIEEISVPAIGPAAPNTSVTGFQWALVKKPKPNLAKAGQPPIAKAMTIPDSEARRAVAADQQTYLKI